MHTFIIITIVISRPYRPKRNTWFFYLRSRQFRCEQPWILVTGFDVLYYYSFQPSITKFQRKRNPSIWHVTWLTGIPPLNLFPERIRCVNLYREPSSVGMLPMNCVSIKWREARLGREPICGGSGYAYPNATLRNSSCVNAFKEPRDAPAPLSPDFTLSWPLLAFGNAKTSRRFSIVTLPAELHVIPCSKEHQSSSWPTKSYQKW